MKRSVATTVMAFAFIVIVCTAQMHAQATKQNEVYSPTLFEDLSFRMVGPTRGGRATTVTGIAEQPGTFYMGATGGGVWKTTDYGQSWANVSDGFFETASIGPEFNKTVEFNLLFDPRVAADGVTQDDLEAQTAFNLEMRDFTSEARMVLHRLESLLEQVRANGSAAAAEEKLAALHAKFVAAEGTYQTPMLIQQIGYLSGMTSRADQRPGNYAYTRLTQLRERLAGYAAELQAILDNDLATLNR